MPGIVVSDVRFLFMLLERGEGKSRLTLLDTFGDLSASALLLRVKVLHREKFIVLEGLLFRLELFDQKVGLGEPAIFQMLEVNGIGACHIPGRYPTVLTLAKPRLYATPLCQQT
ncbi:uncharacterized protein LOC110425006 [Herrania umbratica]|uniref:Uncharacterized protein LOC110425006 n=1 Tax=Herrania umbratica TaxID=108875 RepID=A0A6J1B7Z4_9ROSI|nr:uncharacterized protein LOC110425006 [Herrania umbratica]